MMLDATGAQQIRDAFTTAADTAGEHADDVAGLTSVLAEGAEAYAGLGMAASTVAHLRDAAASTTAAQAQLGEAGERLQAALGDFNARDGRVAEAVATAGNLMLAEAYGESFAPPGAATQGAVQAAVAAAPPALPAAPPARTTGQIREDLEDLINGQRWLNLSEGDPAWRPSPRTPELYAQLATDDRAEDDGADRATCHTHQSWIADCIGDPAHSNPVSGYNWCAQHRSPVQVCRCWPATVDGTPPAVPVLA